MKNVTMAWRNLWRNRRRTLITAASVFFAVIFALVFRSLQLGSYDRMFRNAIESYTGYIQVQHIDFWDEKVVDNSFPYNPEVAGVIHSDPNVVTTVPRFESFALASSGPHTKGVLVMGIDPEKEEYLSGITSRLVNPSESGMIRMGEPGAWVGQGLAEYLELGVGDTVVLIGQGYRATTAAGKYAIKGIVKLPLPDIDNRVVYLPLGICQQMYNAGNNLTSLALHVRDNGDDAVDATLERLTGVIPEGQRMVEWKEMNELLVSQLEADNYSGMIMIGILYLVIAFGVFGTVLMMTAERRREFGVLVAIGMQKWKLAWIITLELFLVGLLGIAAGSAVAIPVILYGVEHPLVFKGEYAAMWEEYGFEPMMVFQGIDTYFLWQLLIVAIIVFIALGYPIRKITGIQVVNALRA